MIGYPSLANTKLKKVMNLEKSCLHKLVLLSIEPRLLFYKSGQLTNLVNFHWLITNIHKFSTSFIGIGDNILTGREIPCLPYEGFFYTNMVSSLNLLSMEIGMLYHILGAFVNVLLLKPKVKIISYKNIPHIKDI